MKSGLKVWLVIALGSLFAIALPDDMGGPENWGKFAGTAVLVLMAALLAIFTVIVLVEAAAYTFVCRLGCGWGLLVSFVANLASGLIGVFLSLYLSSYEPVFRATVQVGTTLVIEVPIVLALGAYACRLVHQKRGTELPCSNSKLLLTAVVVNLMTCVPIQVMFASGRG